MADEVISTTISSESTRAEQSQMPLLITGSYEGGDALYHAMIFNPFGKSKLTYGVDNPTNKDITVTIYGCPSLTSEVGDAGVFLIGTFITATAASSVYGTTTDGFLFYLIRCKSDAATDTPAETVNVYVHLMA